MDDDGLDIGKPTPIHVKVEVRDDRMTIDLTDVVSKQVRGFYNSGMTTGIGLRPGRLQMSYLADGLPDQRRCVPAAWM